MFVLLQLLIFKQIYILYVGKGLRYAYIFHSDKNKNKQFAVVHIERVVVY